MYKQLWWSERNITHEQNDICAARLEQNKTSSIAKATLFELLQQEQFADEMKSVSSENNFQKRPDIALFTLQWQKGIKTCQRQNRQKWTELHCKTSETVILEISHFWNVLP